MIFRITESVKLKFVILWALTFPLLFGIHEGAVKSYSILVISLMCILLGFFYKYKHVLEKKLLRTLIVLAFIFLLFILLPTLFFSKSIIISDLFEIYRPLLYILIFLLPLYFNWSIYLFNKILNCFLIIIIISIFISFFQAFNIDLFILKYYVKVADHWSSLRASGIFPNPYDLGYVSIIPIVYLTLLISEKFDLKKVVLLFFILICILLSQSRTALFLVVISLFLLWIYSIYAIIYYKNNRKIFFKYNFIILCMVLLLTSIITINYDILYDKFSYLIGGIISIFEENNLQTLETRFSQIRYIINGIDSNVLSFVFGNGINKEEARYLESFYIMYQFRFGILGLIMAIIFFIIFPIYLSYKAFRNTYLINIKLSLFFLSLFIWYLITPIALFGNSFVDIPRVNFLFFFFYGLSFYFSKRSNIERFSINNNPIL